MDKHTVKIDHLYNPAKFGLGQLYEDVLEGWEIQHKFYLDQVELSKFINTCKLEDAIFVIIKAYKDRYPTSYFSRVYDNFREPLYPLRKDTKIEWIANQETYDCEKVVFTFQEIQEIQLLKSTIEEVLTNNIYEQRDNSYYVKNSPIISIEVFNTELKINLDISKAIKY